MRNRTLGKRTFLRYFPFLLDFETIQPEAKRQLAEFADQLDIYWVHDSRYYARLKGSADTLESLRRLPETDATRFGRFIDPRE